MTLYILPNLLGRVPAPHDFFAPNLAPVVAQLDGLIAESSHGGRNFLQLFETKKPTHVMPIALLEEDAEFLLEPVVAGENWGVVSDAGMPCIADPGASLIFRARMKKLPIVAVPGPTSMMHALMLSGLPSQRFAFVGYLERERVDHLKRLEQRSKEEKSTQFFMETPYRNEATLEQIIETLHPTTLLCVTCDLTLPEEIVICKPISAWKREKELPQLKRRPAIFLIYAGKNLAKTASLEAN